MRLYETLVYADFIIAVALLVVVPLFLLGISANHAPVRNRLLVYWRASALLGVTVYLWIGEQPMGFATGFAARALIPLALWRGDALMVLRGRSLPTGPDWRATAFRGWRQAAIAYNLLGLAYMLPLLPCVASGAGPRCALWFAPPPPSEIRTVPFRSNTSWSRQATRTVVPFEGSSASTQRPTRAVAPPESTSTVSESNSDAQT